MYSILQGGGGVWIPQGGTGIAKIAQGRKIFNGWQPDPPPPLPPPQKKNISPKKEISD